MTLELQLPSFIFGLIIGLALMLLVGQSYRFLFGGKRLRELGREVSHLRKVVEQKDRYIRKSLDALKKEGIELPEATTRSDK
jgi:hypothetical protein